MCRDNLHSFREALEDTKKFSFFIQELFDFFWIMVMGGGMYGLVVMLCCLL